MLDLKAIRNHAPTQTTNLILKSYPSSSPLCQCQRPPGTSWIRHLDRLRRAGMVGVWFVDRRILIDLAGSVSPMTLVERTRVQGTGARTRCCHR